MISDDIKRLNYYEGQFLRARDFQDEQAYIIEMRRRHLIANHLWGIVAGLEIKQDPFSKIWSVQPGIAIDAFGREILVFDAEPLNMNTIADALSGEPKPATLKVWISYKTEKTTRPSAGYEKCGDEDEFIRVRETFSFVYNDDPVFDWNTKELAKQTVDNPEAWPTAFQDLPDDPKKARWPVYLGTITWDTDPEDASKDIITKVTLADPEQYDFKSQRYAGIVAKKIEAPSNKLLIRGRGNASPLPTDSTKPDYNGVPVKLEGSLQIDRRLNVIGSVGIGIGPLSVIPDTKLQIAGGKEATLEKGSGYAVLGKVDDKNIVLDNHAIMARKKKTNSEQLEPSELALQPKGGDLVVHTDKDGTELIVKDSGYVGIGTKEPLAKLNVFNDAKNSNYADQSVIGLFRGGYAEGDGWNRNRLVIENTISQGEVSVDLRLDDPSGNERGTHLYQRKHHFGIWRSKVGTRLAINNAGNVGIGTTDPDYVLDVVGRMRVQQLEGGGTAGIWFYQTEPAKDRAFVGMDGDDKMGFWGNGGAGWGMVMDVTTGNVGIGTTSPAYRLDVKAKRIKLGLEENGGGQLHIFNNANDNKIFIEAFNTTGDGHADELLLTGRHAENVPRLSLRADITDVNGRILRKGMDFSETGERNNGGTVLAPWGTTDDWNIFVSPRWMGEEEHDSEGDNALLKIECFAAPFSNAGWRITAQYKYKYSNGYPVNGSWRDGQASYILVPR